MLREHWSIAVVCWFLTFIMVATPVTQAFASGKAPKASQQGQAFGKDQIPDPSSLFGSDDDDYVVFPGDKDAIKIDPSELFGGSNGRGNTDDIEDLWGDDSGITDKTGTVQKYLSTSQNPRGEAYRTLKDSKNHAHMDLSKDPIFDNSRHVMEELFAGKGDFSACNVSRKVMAGKSTTKHLADYQFCTKKEVVDSCKVTHDYKVGILKYKGGEANIQSCGEGCVQVWLGKVGDNYWSGWCSIFEEDLQFQILNPDAIISATLDHAKWDDYMQIWFAGEKVWSGPHGDAFPPETSGDCELSTSWERSLSVDMTDILKSKAPGSIINSKIRVSVSGEGEGYAHMTIHFDPRKSLTNDVWDYEDGCKKAVDAVKNGAVKGDFVCEKKANVRDGCVRNAGTKACEGKQFDSSPFPDISPTCKQVRVTTGFGDASIQGSAKDGPDACTKLEDDSSCRFVSSSCAVGGGQNGDCYIYNVKYDCGKDVEVPSANVETDYQCPGGIRCMGGSCIDIDEEQNKDFAKAVSLLQVADQAAMDMHCPDDTEDKNNVKTCKIFKGEKSECKIAMFGIQNCCDLPTAANLSDYITLMLTARKVAGFVGDYSTMVEGVLNSMNGAWETVTEPITQGLGEAWDYVSSPFANALDANSAATAGRKIGLSAFKQAAMKKTAMFLAKNFSPAIANALFVSGGTGGAAVTTSGELTTDAAASGVQLGGALGSMMSGVMMAYAIYTFAKLAIKLVYKCEDDEFKLRAKRQLKSAHYIGSYCKQKNELGLCIEKRRVYCTFNSPLSRIIQEQVRAQLGEDFGDAEHADCKGIAVEDMNKVDWDKIDLSEWLAILQTTGHLSMGPDSEYTYAMDRLTGKGNKTLDVDVPGAPPRTNTLKRNRSRLHYQKDGNLDDQSKKSKGALHKNEDLRQAMWKADSFCIPGYALFTPEDGPSSFQVHPNCGEVHITAEGGDSGGAGNLKAHAGQHVEMTLNVQDADVLKINAGKGGGIDTNWNEYRQDAYYKGLGGTATTVKRGGQTIINAKGGGETNLTHTYSSPYWQGQSGWVLISWGDPINDPPELPKRKPLNIGKTQDPTPCHAGTKMFNLAGKTRFKVPNNCTYLRIVEEGADSGGANNIPINRGQHKEDVVSVMPKDNLRIEVGAGGDVDSFWNVTRPAYYGKAGGDTGVYNPDNSIILQARGGKRTGNTKTRGSQYWRGANGWVWLAWGPGYLDKKAPGNPNSPEKVPAPPAPEHPCDAGRKRFDYKGGTQSFELPWGCHYAKITVAGSGGGGGDGHPGGAGAVVTGELHDQKPGPSGLKYTIRIDKSGVSQDGVGTGGGRSAFLHGSTPLLVAGGGGGGTNQAKGGSADKTGAPGSSAKTCTRINPGEQGEVGGDPAKGGTEALPGEGALACTGMTFHREEHCTTGKDGIQHCDDGGWSGSGKGGGGGGAYGYYTYNTQAGESGTGHKGGASTHGGGGGDGYYGGGAGAAGSSGAGGSSYLDASLKHPSFKAGQGGMGGLSNARGENGWVIVEWQKHKDSNDWK